jgi:hypothetical protein
MDCSFPHETVSKTEHMNMRQCKEQLEMLQRMGCVRDSASVYLSHIGHNVNGTHLQLEQKATAIGLHVAYDGLQIQI